MDLAVRRLDLVAASPALTPELHIWAQFSLGIAAFLEGDPRRAESALKQAAEQTEAGAELKNFLAQLEANAPAPAGEGEPVSEIWSPLLRLWQGLAALNRHQLKEAQSLFEKASDPASHSTVPRPELLSLTPLLLTQVHNFQALEVELEAASKAEVRAARLRKAEELLQTMHPAVFMRARAGELIAQAKATPVRAPENNAPTAPALSAPAPVPTANAKATGPAPAPAPPSLQRIETLRAKASQDAQHFQFKEALDAAASFSPAHETEKNAVAALQRQILTMQGLFVWAIQEINRGGTLPSPILRNGSAFKSDPIKADSARVLVTISPGTPPVPVAWTDISPLFLVKLVQFRLTTQPSHPQRAELLWGAGQVHLFLGSRQNAKPFLEEAARLNPAYTPLMTAALAGG
jgi:tetratricopeptide (TPR) repeat protein